MYSDEEMSNVFTKILGGHRTIEGMLDRTIMEKSSLLLNSFGNSLCAKTSQQNQVAERKIHHLMVELTPSLMDGCVDAQEGL